MAQRTLFVGPSAVANKELYAVVTKGGSTRDRTELRLHAGARAHTDTFFGRFPAGYWQRYTDVREVTARVRVTATASCRVLLVASDVGGHRRIIAAEDAVGEQIVSLTGALEQFVDGGSLWLEFEALDAETGFSDVEWVVAAQAPPSPTVIVICTYNRPADCAATVAALASDDRLLERVDTLYVVDQGTDLVVDQPGFIEAAPCFGDGLRYLRQPNLGGAGGFTQLPERRQDTQYNGWWSCLIPAAVWHADFYWKDVDGFGHYFSVRNGLVTAALDDSFAPGRLAVSLSRMVLQAIVGMQYGLAHTLLRAVEGFLDGPGGLDDGGVAALAAINAERREFGDTVVRPASATPSVGMRRAAPPPNPALIDAVLAKRLPAHVRGRLEPGPISISYEDAQWWHVSRFSHAYVTDASQRGVRERRHDRRRAVEQARRLRSVIARFRAEAPAVALAYRADADRLASRDNWARLFGE